MAWRRARASCTVFALAVVLLRLQPMASFADWERHRCTAAGGLNSSSVELERGMTYNDLPSFEEATEKFYGFTDERREGLLAGLLTIVHRHGVQDIVGIDIKHRHFEMPIGHCLLEVQDLQAKESVMKPAPHTVPKVPFAYMLAGGSWVPYEFVEPRCEEAAAGLAMVQDRPSFLTELKDFLVESGVDDILGFHVLHRTHLGGAGTIETPGRGQDELLIRPHDAEEVADSSSSSSSEVLWTFARKDDTPGMPDYPQFPPNPPKDPYPRPDLPPSPPLPHFCLCYKDPTKPKYER